MIYEEHVRKVAEEMQSSNSILTVNEFNLESVFIPAACIAVRRQAELLKGYLTELGFPERVISQELIDRGLIPLATCAGKENVEWRPCKPTNENPFGHPKESLRPLPTLERAFHCNACGYTIVDPDNKIHV